LVDGEMTDRRTKGGRSRGGDGVRDRRKEMTVKLPDLHWLFFHIVVCLGIIVEGRATRREYVWKTSLRQKNKIVTMLNCRSMLVSRIGQTCCSWYPS
jgi:hypothetical protein